MHLHELKQYDEEMAAGKLDQKRVNKNEHFITRGPIRHARARIMLAVEDFNKYKKKKIDEMEL